MRRISSNSESGAILLIVIILMLALTITGVAFLNAGVMEYRLAKREDYKNKAFYIAEGGLERTLWNLKQHFSTDFSSRWPSEANPAWPAWPTGFVNGIPVIGSSSWTILYGEYDEPGSSPPEEGMLGAGSYEVKLEYISGEDKIRIESTGTVENVSRTVQIYLEKGYFYPWDTAIFAGQAAAGATLINGNVLVAGSILILAEHLDPFDPEEDPVVELMDLAGTAGIRNNYEEMEILLAEVEPGIRRIPECPKKDYEYNDIVYNLESLEATLRVRHGQVRAGGTVMIGQENFPNPGIKGTLDGVYVDGHFDLRGSAAVYSDNPISTTYDLGDMIKFPSLLRDHPDYGIPRIEYLQNPSYSAILQGITEISSNVESFWADENGKYDTKPDPWPPGGDNYIAWDQEQGKLTISGIIYVEQDFLKLGEKNERIEYNGTGTIVVARRGSSDIGDPEYESIVGGIRVHGDLLAEGGYYAGEGFPHNVLGLVTGDLHIAGPGEAHIMATGAFFAENVVKSDKQNEIAGTFIAGRFDIETNVPRLYQVRELKDNLPRGIPGGVPIEVPVFKDWSES